MKNVTIHELELGALPVVKIKDDKTYRRVCLYEQTGDLLNDKIFTGIGTNVWFPEFKIYQLFQVSVKDLAKNFPEEWLINEIIRLTNYLPETDNEIICFIRRDALAITGRASSNTMLSAVICLGYIECIEP